MTATISPPRQTTYSPSSVSNQSGLRISIRRMKLTVIGYLIRNLVLERPIAIMRVSEPVARLLICEFSGECRDCA